MSPQSEELRDALAWRKIELNYYRNIIENAGSAEGLTDQERESVRRAAMEKMRCLQQASNDEVVKLYNFNMAVIMAMFKAVCVTADELID